MSRRSLQPGCVIRAKPSLARRTNTEASDVSAMDASGREDRHGTDFDSDQVAALDLQGLTASGSPSEGCAGQDDLSASSEVATIQEVRSESACCVRLVSELPAGRSAPDRSVWPAQARWERMTTPGSSR